MSQSIIQLHRPGQLQLSALPPLTLYVHLPWCLRKCPYCDFNSHEAQGEFPQERYLQALRADHPQARVFPREPLTLGTLLKAIRLKQWAKNALLFVPLLAAHSAEPQAWLQALLAFVAFGLCASAT